MLCPKCARAVSLEYGQTKCPHCGAEIGPDVTAKMEGGLRPPSSEPSQSVSPQTLSPSDRPSTPLWDNDGPFFTRLFNTWKETMFHPGRFFKQTPTDGGLGKPLLYAIIIGFISIVFTALPIPFFGADKKSLEAIPFLQQYITYIMIGYVILSPIFITIGAFIGSGILHLSLMIVGGNKKGFEATFRSVTYAYSPMLFGLIPFCGAYIGGIWAMVVAIIGFKETHRISTGKAVIAYFLPMIFCCICGVVLALVVGIGMFGALSKTMPH